MDSAKHIGRKITLSVLFFVASFITGILNGIVHGTDFESSASITDFAWITAILVHAIILVGFSVLYFKPKQIAYSAREGALFGMTVVITATIIEIVIFRLIVLFASGPTDSLSYFANIWYWVSVVVTFFVPVLVGAWGQKRARQTSA